MFFLKSRIHTLPRPRIPQVSHAVLEGVEAALKVQLLDHLQHQIQVGGVLDLLEHIKHLATPQRERITKNGIICDMRREIVELRASARIMLRAHDRCDRWRIQMKKGVDTGATRNNRHRAPRLE